LEANASGHADGLQAMVEAILFEGYTHGDFARISKAELEGVYAAAYNLVNIGQYEKGERVFEFLNFLNHYDTRFWLGLGVCRQLQKEYEKAIEAYSMAGINDVSSPVPPLRAAECHLALGRLDQAESGAQAALALAGAAPAVEAVRARAEIILNGIRRRRQVQS
jgi:type III secretion system low calcium response chaperone LcrH/SycD